MRHSMRRGRRVAPAGLHTPLPPPGLCTHSGAAGSEAGRGPRRLQAGCTICAGEMHFARQSWGTSLLGTPVGLEYSGLQPLQLYIWLQPVLLTVAASAPYGCSFCYLRLQPLLHTVAAAATYGCSFCCLRLQPLLLEVAASAPYGCSLCSIRLQLLLLTVAASAT